MLSIPGRPGRTCEGWSRRELLRVGGLTSSASACPTSSTRSRRGKAARRSPRAKSVIMIFLQGGPSHIDIWDPKPDAPANIRGEFKPIKTKVAGIQRQRDHADAGRARWTSDAHPIDELHAGRPVQSHRRDLPDDDRLYAGQGVAVGPARAAVAARFPAHGLPRLEDDAGRRSRCCRSSSCRGRCRNRTSSARAAPPASSARRTIRIACIRTRPSRSTWTISRCGKEVPPERLKDRFELLKGINGSMPDLEKAVENYALDRILRQGVRPGAVRQGARRVRSRRRSRTRCASATAATRSGRASCSARRLIEAGTRFVQVNWPAVANGNPEVDAWDTHAANFGPLKNLHCPKLDRACRRCSKTWTSAAC